MRRVNVQGDFQPEVGADFLKGCELFALGAHEERDTDLGPTVPPVEVHSMEA